MKKALPGQLRIIGGQWRGRKLNFTAAPGLRPTADRIRETLFNWLAPVIYGQRCLDLFAGSGALGFEALSREAGHCTFVDLSAKVCNQLEANLKMLNCHNAKVIQADALKWIECSEEPPFDLVFLDPPFHFDLIAPCCQAIQQQHLVKPGSYLYTETERGAELNLTSEWHPYREKQTGNVSYSLYRFEP